MFSVFSRSSPRENGLSGFPVFRSVLLMFLVLFGHRQPIRSVFFVLFGVRQFSRSVFLVFKQLGRASPADLWLLVLLVFLVTGSPAERGLRVSTFPVIRFSGLMFRLGLEQQIYYRKPAHASKNQHFKEFPGGPGCGCLAYWLTG